MRPLAANFTSHPLKPPLFYKLKEIKMTKKQYIVLIIILGIVNAFAPLAIDMYLASLPTLTKHFNTSHDMVQLTLASFFVGFSLGQAFYGPISDKYGRKIPLYIGLLIFTLSSIGCAFSSSVEWLIFFRFLEAIGACAGGVISRAIVRDMFKPQNAAKIYSYLMLITGLAPILAPLLGGYILIYFGWQAIFLTLALLGAVSLISVKLFLKDNSQKMLHKKLSFTAVIKEYIEISKNKTFMGYALLGGFCMAAMFAYITSSPFVFMEFFSLSVEEHGFLFGANAFSFIVAAQVNARLVNKLSAKHLIQIPVIIMAICGVVLFVNSFFEIGGLLGIALPVVCYMLCIGFIVPNATAQAMAPFSTNAGSASALLGVLQFSFAAASSITLGFLHTNPLHAMGITILLCSFGVLATYLTLLHKR